MFYVKRKERRVTNSVVNSSDMICIYFHLIVNFTGFITV